ncbi:MAG TPA: tRNA preQ1(34) S-adenosylmethionine ribosyltransferase-isomerase QueA [Candidatus Avidehalobacter gallistercoris]|uniref:S-adenosylmethionine:tRNA ribosyltransferase-isomerase n=1 Tax=Candidatus Avidehalobacter gallistercoris TaxID=2840694 RepID=A0A9D1HIA0_9FIRM|nr:tRNA preQ1(34) S-adenosylmethionine ribosyltransferase-isomerase QueA [Candidatus Avidehalobacter gallistercoris]
MKLEEFVYDLPERLIAQTPVEPRDASRLLVLHRADGNIEHKHFYNVIDYLAPQDVLVINHTKVLPARLWAHRDSGALIEVLLVQQVDLNHWKALVRPGRKVRAGEHLTFADGILDGQVEEVVEEGMRLIRFDYQGNFMEILDKLGTMPLPPYIHEELKDQSRYQCVYAKDPGSAAAPTAGLHFTNELLDRIRAKGVAVAEVLLNVGLGTFRPVKVENIEEHQMHAEYYSVDKATARLINERRAAGGRIVAVGTTSTRTLETVSTDDGIVHAGSGWTQKFIYPGYRYKAVDALITNFHLPGSTLMMLVSAFATREQIMQAYRQAVADEYRFFSFGDAMLIL